MPRRRALRQATQLRPGDAMAWIELADAELDAGDLQAGEAAARRGLSLAPGHPEALARIGRAQSMSGRHAEAVASMQAAARAAPTHPGIAIWLGHAYEAVAAAEQAVQAYAQAHALLPGEPRVAAPLLAWKRRICDWQGLDALARQVGEAVDAGIPAADPFDFLAEDATPARQLHCARLHAAQYAPLARVVPSLPAMRVADPATALDAPLRIGFLSNGFGAHPTGLLTVALFEAIAAMPQAAPTAAPTEPPSAALSLGVQVHLFALQPDDGSLVARRLRAAVHATHDVSAMGYDAVAARIAAQSITVLFDLRGWGGGGMPAALALRPAPVQVNWLAYPGSSGAPWIDYVMADDFVLPAALAPHFSEAVALLPRCFQPSDTRRAIPAAPPRSSCGLPATGTVFCAFNNSYKINPASFARCVAVLRGVPGSVLWLLATPGEGNARLRAAAAAAGVDPARLVFMAKQPHADYMARLQLADLFLDATPYNAHTTASDALWAGCPVLTLPGSTFAARVAGSLNHHLGMPDMNAADEVAFVARAVALGNDRVQLDGLRERLRICVASSGVFDMPGFAHDFIALAWRMARRHRDGVAPAHLAAATGSPCTGVAARAG